MLAGVAAASGIAAAIDLRTGRIPNPLTATVAAAGLGLAAFGLTGHSIAGAACGAAVGFALMLPGHLLGGTGAGDVKLLAALGTWLGPGGVLMAFLYSAIAGGVLAAAHAASRRRHTTRRHPHDGAHNRGPAGRPIRRSHHGRRYGHQQ